MILLVHGSPPLMKRRHLENFGHLLNPLAGNRIHRRTAYHWAVENGAYGKRGFDPVAFLRLLDQVEPNERCLYVACPDKVGDAWTTLQMFGHWLPQIRSRGFPIALVAQDGAERCNIPWGHFECLFIGGTTKWKLSKAAESLSLCAKHRGKWLHWGRVNSLRRMRRAWDLGADSIDGSMFNKFSETHLLRGLRWIRQLEAQPTLLPNWKANLMGTHNLAKLNRRPGILYRDPCRIEHADGSLSGGIMESCTLEGPRQQARRLEALHLGEGQARAVQFGDIVEVTLRREKV